MPKKSEPVEVKEEMVAKTEEVLVPFSVIIDGQDRTIFAKDQDDLQVRIARIRAS